jgi:hypothetical protein
MGMADYDNATQKASSLDIRITLRRTFRPDITMDACGRSR